MKGIIPSPFNNEWKPKQQWDTYLILTLLAPRALVPTPSTRGDHPKYLKNDKRYKSETLGEVLGVYFKVSKNFKLIQLLLGNHGNHSTT